jgi:mRNA interferase RelE/StbE
MSFEIEYSVKALKFLESLSKDTCERIINKVDSLKENPFRFLEHFEGDYYKLRIGDYRLLIDVDFDGKKIIIQVLDKRGKIYKR